MVRDTSEIDSDVVPGTSSPNPETTLEALIRAYNRMPLDSDLGVGDLLQWDGTDLVKVDLSTASEGDLLTVQADGTVAPASGTSQLWLSARDFELVQSTPTLSKNPNNTGGEPAWLFDSSTVEAISTLWALPSGWSTFDITAVWTNAGAGSGDVVWRSDYRFFGAGDNYGSTGYTSPSQVAGTAGAQNVEVNTVLASGVSVTASKRLSLRIYRLASDGSDTLGNDAALHGLLIDKAS